MTTRSRTAFVAVGLLLAGLAVGCTRDGTTTTTGNGATGADSIGAGPPASIPDVDGGPPREGAPTIETTVPPGPGIEMEGTYVDVDLVCRAFRLDQVWVIAEGDTSSWQPPGERHEGGLFVQDTADSGTFRGDAAGTKVATFRRLGDDETPPCEPVPRPAFAGQGGQ